MNDGLIDIELVVMYLVILVTAVVTVGSVIRSLRLRDKSQNSVNNIPVTKIAYVVAALLVVCLLITFLTGSSKPIRLGENMFTNTFWLKATDMFIYSSAILIIIAIGCVIYGMSGLSRKSKNERRKHVPSEEA
jgi:Na+/melibiose symporter-like transporter